MEIFLASEVHAAGLLSSVSSLRLQLDSKTGIYPTPLGNEIIGLAMKFLAKYVA
jgi:hypothetical protein